MTRFRVLFAVLGLAAAMAAPAQDSICLGDRPAPRRKGIVVKVSDGDTIWVEINGKREKVRFESIDAPESDQKGGKESREFLASLVMGHEVETASCGHDRYGRLVATVWRDGRDVNLAMVEAGHAWAYRRYGAPAGYVAAEERAKTAKLGLWRDANAVPPWEWRRQKRAKDKRK